MRPVLTTGQYATPAMAICHPHNLNRPIILEQRPYGIRVSLQESDPFRNLLGAEWQKFHWYPTARERDEALLEMSRRHDYSRAKDKPAVVFKKVEKLAESRGL
jgi:hypothetical protein